MSSRHHRRRSPTGRAASSTSELPAGQRIAKTPFGRLVPRRDRRSTSGAGGGSGSAISGVLIVITLVSLSSPRPQPRHRLRGRRGLGRAGRPDVTVDDRPRRPRRQRHRTAARPRSRSARPSSGDIIKVQVGDQPEDVRVAGAGGVRRRRPASTPADVSVASVSSTWGAQITQKAIRALIVFLVLIAIVHLDPLRVADGGGGDPGHAPRRARSASASTRCSASRSPRRPSSPSSPSSASRCTTPSSCSTRSRRTSARVAAAGLPYGDMINVSMNQVLMRSLNTTLAAVLPVLSLLRHRRRAPRRGDAARVRPRPARRPDHRRRTRRSSSPRRCSAMLKDARRRPQSRTSTPTTSPARTCGRVVVGLGVLRRDRPAPAQCVADATAGTVGADGRRATSRPPSGPATAPASTRSRHAPPSSC